MELADYVLLIETRKMYGHIPVGDGFLGFLPGMIIPNINTSFRDRNLAVIIREIVNDSKKEEAKKEVTATSIGDDLKAKIEQQYPFPFDLEDYIRRYGIVNKGHTPEFYKREEDRSRLSRAESNTATYEAILMVQKEHSVYTEALFKRLSFVDLLCASFGYESERARTLEDFEREYLDGRVNGQYVYQGALVVIGNILKENDLKKAKQVLSRVLNYFSRPEMKVQNQELYKQQAQVFLTHFDRLYIDVTAFKEELGRKNGVDLSGDNPLTQAIRSKLNY